MKTKKISAMLATSLLLGAAVFSSCSKSDTPSLPAIGGYNTSNDIAAANLLAHWTFDGTLNEAVSNTAPTTKVNNTFVTGASGSGQALQLNSGFVLYPTISALSSASALASFTLSAWVKAANNGSTASEIFALSNPAATDWGQMINFHLETGQKKATSDTLIIHGLLGQYASGTRSGQDNLNSGGAADAGVKYKVVKGASKWTHVVMKYDASTSTIDIYGNGQVVSNSDYRQRGTLGALVFQTPSQVVIGGFPSIATGFAGSSNQVWQGLFNGSIDEIRVYNKALSDADVNSLFQLESAGR